MPSFCVGCDASTLSGDTLLMPAVSVGNVGQLAADLMISSLSAKRVGYLRSKAVLPVVGMGAFEDGVLSTALEVYRSSEFQVTIVQQRAPLMKGTAAAFIDELAGWIAEVGFCQTVLLSSADASYRNDQQLAGQLQFMAAEGDASSKLGAKLEAMGLSSLISSSRGEDEVFVSKRGFSRQLLEVCAARGHSAVVLLSLCYEGDNVPQSLQLASAVIQLLGLADKGVQKIVMPASWRHISGAPFDHGELY